MKQKYYTEFIKIRNKKCRQSQFGTFCQITPPLINLNPLSNAASYKAKFSVVEGCLTSIFCLNLIQFLCMLILSHQELLAQNQARWSVNTTHTRALSQDREVPQSSIPQCTEVLEIPFPQTGAQLNLSYNPCPTAVVENAHTVSASQKSATAFYHLIYPVTTKISNPYQEYSPICCVFPHNRWFHTQKNIGPDRLDLACAIQNLASICLGALWYF